MEEGGGNERGDNSVYIHLDYDQIINSQWFEVKFDFSDLF